MRKPTAKGLRRAGCLVGLALVALEFLCPRYLMLPGPLTQGFVGTYNGIQWARANLPTPTRLERRRKAAGPPPDPRVVGAGNDFGLRLFRRLCDANPGENVFYSPCSVNAAMCLTLNGAGSLTKAGMESALGLKGIPLSDVNKAQHRMAELLTYSDPSITVAASNSLWADTRFPFNADFIRTANDTYEAHAENLNLSDASTPDRINAWIKDHTEGEISGGVQPFAESDSLVLVNALYFHGIWRQKFNRNDTHPEPFQLTPATRTTVPMMWRHGGCTLLYDQAPVGRFTAARLPYGDGSMSMYVFVPDEGFDLSGFLTRVNRANWDTWMAGFRDVEGDIGLPRMNLRFDQRLEGPLNAMGMRMGRRLADFRPMGSSRYYVSQVRQQVMLDVDEDGATAATITIEVIPTLGIAPRVVADRPFFLAIRDDRSGAILFAGAIYDPQPPRR